MHHFRSPWPPLRASRGISQKSMRPATPFSPTMSLIGRVASKVALSSHPPSVLLLAIRSRPFEIKGESMHLIVTWPLPLGPFAFVWDWKGEQFPNYLSFFTCEAGFQVPSGWASLVLGKPR